MPTAPRVIAPSPVVEPTTSLRAAAPTRATGTLTLGFGTTSIPCSLFAGCEDSKISRSEYVERDGQFLKVGRQAVIKTGDSEHPLEGSKVETSEIVKLVAADNGSLIPLSDDEIAAAIGCEGGYAQIDRFLPLSTLNAGFYVIDSLYQLRPAPARTGRTNLRSSTTEAAFALLIKAMRLESVFALVRVALRGKPRYAAFMPDGRMYTLRFESEMRLPLPLPSTVGLADEDVMLARMVVAIKTSTVAPALVDEATQAVQAFIDNKARDVLPEPTPIPIPDNSYAVLIENLRASVTGLSVAPSRPSLLR